MTLIHGFPAVHHWLRRSRTASPRARFPSRSPPRRASFGNEGTYDKRSQTGGLKLSGNRVGCHTDRQGRSTGSSAATSFVQQGNGVPFVKGMKRFHVANTIHEKRCPSRRTPYKVCIL